MDRSTKVTRVVLNREERKAFITTCQPDGIEVQSSVELSEAVVGHLGGGEMVQLKFPDGTTSEKIEPYYLPASKEAPPTPPAVPWLLGIAMLSLAIGAYWWRRRARRG